MRRWAQPAAASGEQSYRPVSPVSQDRQDHSHHDHAETSIPPSQDQATPG
jgi:hypothetical protein